MPKTEVILTHNIVGLGGESDNVKVAAGYARNYLYPQGLAVPVSGANKRRLEVLRQRRAEREAHEFNTMSELSKSISKLIAVITMKTGDDGKMFGSVTSGSIADVLKNADAVMMPMAKAWLHAPSALFLGRGMQVATTRPARSTVARSHSARISASLWLI